MFFYLREIASAEQVECILGSWCMATRDAERQVAQVAQRSWDAHISLDADSDTAAHVAEKEEKRLVLDRAQRAALLLFLQRALLDPLALHAYLNPVQVPVEVVVPRAIRGRPVPTPVVAAQTRRTDSELSARVKGESEEESETDRKARLRIGALGALQGRLGVWTRYATSVASFSKKTYRCSLSGARTQVTRRSTRHPLRCAVVEFSSPRADMSIRGY
jgi:E3 ubiquitin-protein ligase listerin